MDNEHVKQDLPSSVQPVHEYSFSKKQIAAAIIVVLLAFAILWIWKSAQLRSQAKEFAQREIQLVDKTNAFLDSNHVHFLKLVAKPYVWAVRTELMQGNLSQVNLYGNDIVKEKNFVSVMIADEKGTVITSTDKKFEGKALSALGVAVDMNADVTGVTKLSDSLYRVTSPVMSFNSKLGTLIINYRPGRKMVADTTGVEVE